MRIDFAKIIRLAKEQTATNFPTIEEFANQLYNGGAASLICHTASEILNETTPVEDDNYAHFVVEEVLGLACVEIFNAQRR
jgi:predicted peroxiredoxin